MKQHLSSDLKVLFDQTRALFQSWMNSGQIAQIDPDHLIFSIWATTQHYADFGAQIDVLTGPKKSVIDTADAFLENLYTKLLTPDA